MKKIFISGVSSFTGMWFANTLSSNKFKVHGSLTRLKSNYVNIENKRLNNLNSKIFLHENVTYNSNKIIELIKLHKFDFFHFHGCYTKNYNADNFNLYRANYTNNYNLKKIIQALKYNNCRRLIYTGTIYEKNEGTNNKSNEAITDYGISKSITFNKIKYYCSKYQLPLLKIVIPNPFGEYESERFNYYLFTSWNRNEIPKVNYPKYIRDNIYIEDIAYKYLEELKKINIKSFYKIRPTGFSCNVLDFTKILKEQYELYHKVRVKFEINNSLEHKLQIKRVNGKNNNYFLSNKRWSKYFQYYSY